MRKIRSMGLLCIVTAFAFSACQQSDESMINGENDQTIPSTRVTALENFARHLIVEVNDVNILNAGEYYLSNGEPFFTHVVIYSSNIRGDFEGNVFAYNNSNNAAILANPAKYIAPLQAKGIKVLLGYLGDHTGAGFANLTESQAESFCNQMVAVGDAANVDGYFLDDEWSEYGTRGWPIANNSSFSNVVVKLHSKTNKIITLLDWGNTYTLSPQACECINFAQYGALNGYGISMQFPKSQYLPLSIDLTGPISESSIRVRTLQAIHADAGGVGLYNLPMQPKRLSSLNAVALAFGLTCTHTGVMYPKDYPE